MNLHGSDFKKLLVFFLIHVEAGLNMLDQLPLVHLRLRSLLKKGGKLVLRDGPPIGQFDTSAALRCRSKQMNRCYESNIGQQGELSSELKVHPALPSYSV